MTRSNLDSDIISTVTFLQNRESYVNNYVIILKAELVQIIDKYLILQ